MWVKSRGDDPVRPDLFGARPATADRHPIPGHRPGQLHAQLGVPGPWWDRLPHFRMGFTPSAGEELQSEYLVPRAHADRGDRGRARRSPHAIRPLLQVSEIRTSPPTAVDEPAVRPGHDRHPLHVEARAGRRRARCSRTSRPRWSRSARARTGASCSVRAWRRATSAARTSPAWPSGSTRAARSATPGSNSACWDHSRHDCRREPRPRLPPAPRRVRLRGADRRLAAEALRPRRARQRRAAGAARDHPPAGRGKPAAGRRQPPRGRVRDRPRRALPDRARLLVAGRERAPPAPVLRRSPTTPRTCRRSRTRAPAACGSSASSSSSAAPGSRT